MLSTSPFVVTGNKLFCSLFPMASFPKRMQEAVRRCGGQSELARKLGEVYGVKIKPQTIQYLQSETPSKKTGKVAQGSRLTPQIAALAGLSAEWLGADQGPKEAAGGGRGHEGA
jgi:hypothetical protein